MSLFEDGQYQWRETYFVLFPAKNRPALEKVRQALSMVGDQLQFCRGDADVKGRIKSMTIIAPEDFAAIDISFLSGEEVVEQAHELADEMTAAGCQEDVSQQLRTLRKFDARFDVLHFEQVAGAAGQEEPEGMLNPSTLLLVLDCLAQLTDGLAVDPQTGTFVQ
jgi:hypothetical protein